MEKVSPLPRNHRGFRASTSSHQRHSRSCTTHHPTTAFGCTLKQRPRHRLDASLHNVRARNTHARLDAIEYSHLARATRDDMVVRDAACASFFGGSARLLIIEPAFGAAERADLVSAPFANQSIGASHSCARRLDVFLSLGRISSFFPMRANCYLISSPMRWEKVSGP